jgi:hypothetical protein
MHKQVSNLTINFNFNKIIYLLNEMLTKILKQIKIKSYLLEIKFWVLQYGTPLEILLIIKLTGGIQLILNKLSDLSLVCLCY